MRGIKGKFSEGRIAKRSDVKKGKKKCECGIHCPLWYVGMYCTIIVSARKVLNHRTQDRRNNPNFPMYYRFGSMDGGRRVSLKVKSERGPAQEALTHAKAAGFFFRPNNLDPLVSAGPVG